MNFKDISSISRRN